MNDFDDIKATLPKPKLLQFDLEFLKEDIIVPSYTDAKAKYVKNY